MIVKVVKEDTGNIETILTFNPVLQFGFGKLPHTGIGVGEMILFVYVLNVIFPNVAELPIKPTVFATSLNSVGPEPHIGVVDGPKYSPVTATDEMSKLRMQVVHTPRLKY